MQASVNQRPSTAILAIFLIPLIWGMGFPLTHNAVQVVDAGLYAFCRALVAVVAFLPLVWSEFKKSDKATVFAGLLLGLFSALNILGQSYALQTLSSATTAFLVALNIVFIPFVFFLISQNKPTKTDLISVVVGVVGAYIILNPKMSTFSVGYLWGGLSAFAIAMGIALIGKLTHSANDKPVNRGLLSFYQLLFCMVFLSYFPATLPMTKSWQAISSPKVWGAILYMGVLSTAFALYLQINYQQQVGTTKTAVIFNLDLIFASLFGWLNQEPLYRYQMLGGLVIFISALVEPVARMLKMTKTVNKQRGG